jgi:cation:H+ antiporter
MAGLGVLLTAVYIAGLVLRPKRAAGPIGMDSAAVLLLYALGILGLTQV